MAWKWIDRLLDSMEEDSRHWKIRGRACGHETSWRKAGGLRFGRWGYSLKLGHCAVCGRFGLIEVYYSKPASEVAPEG